MLKCFWRNKKWTIVITQKKPKIFLVLKILASVLIVAGIVLIIIGATMDNPDMSSSGWFDAQSSRNGFIFCGVGVLIVGIFLLLTAFVPSFQKINIKTKKYIIDQNKEDLQDISSQAADIVSPAVTKVTKAVKDGARQSKFCKDCGAKIDEDAKFCPFCGKKQ